MLRTLTLAAVLAGAATVCAADRPDKGQAKGGAAPAAAAPPPAPTVPVLHLAPCTRPARALEYRLLPPQADLKPGNAALLWLRAGTFVHTVKPPMTDKEWDWLSRDKTPLKDFPRKEVRDFLKRYEAGLRLADQAARCDHCDWQRPPLTFQRVNVNDPTWLPLEEIQYYRHLAAVLPIRYRLELSEGCYDQAIRTLQTGFALARDLVGRDLLIQDLVGIAIGAIMLGHLEEWVQTPGSPNLYWSLTELPRPLFNVRPTVERELNTVYRSFPRLREARQGTLTARQAEELFDEVIAAVRKVAGAARDVPAWAANLNARTLAEKHHAEARKYLLAHGYKEAQVNALPATQAVLLYFLGLYDRECDDILKWMSAPPWQAVAGLNAAERRARDLSGDLGTVRLLLPALTKTYEAQVRTERYVAGLRGAEALRLYAADHGGRPPAKWADIKDVPMPTDPLTGQGLDVLYRLDGGKSVLDLSAPPGRPALIGRRYVLRPAS
jgi:hypothetical protein